MDETAPPRRWTWLVLFTSATTLICCTLPILMVTLAQYKAWVFAGSGALLLLTAWLLYNHGRICPTDPVLAAEYERIRRWNSRFFRISVGIWLAGFGTACLALPIYLWVGGN